MFDFTSALLWSIAARKLPALLALSSDVNPLTWNTVLTCFHLLHWVCASKDKSSFGGIFISGNRWAWSFLMQYWKNLTVLWFFAKPYKIIRVNDHYHVGFIMFCKSSKDENMDASLFDFKFNSRLQLQANCSTTILKALHQLMSVGDFAKFTIMRLSERTKWRWRARKRFKMKTCEINGGYIVQFPDTLNYRRVPEIELETPGK